MEKHGIFISYRHEDWALAGRIHDFLESKGMHPFWDVTIQQGHFPEQLRLKIQQAPYFLCVLNRNTFYTDNPDDWVYKELEIALSDPQKKILLIADGDFEWTEQLPEKLTGGSRDIRECQYIRVNRDNFTRKMEDLCRRDIDWRVLSGVLDWRQRIASANNVYLGKREYIERTLAPLSDRFGAELVKALGQNMEYDGENHIRFIHMSCYAASIIFSNQQDMVDERAFDLGMMFNIFAWLLRDPAFNLEIVINAPGGVAMQDAIDQEKLGNSALETCPEAIFLSSYSNISRLIREEPIFVKAYKEKRFRFMVTENVLPYALFQVEYKPEYEQYSHVKVDLYSEGLTSNMDRRCMMIFKEDDPENYNFFVRRYEYTRNPKKSKMLIQKNHDQWVAQWEQLKEEL